MPTITPVECHYPNPITKWHYSLAATIINLCRTKWKRQFTANLYVHIEHQNSKKYKWCEHNWSLIFPATSWRFSVQRQEAIILIKKDNLQYVGTITLFNLITCQCSIDLISSSCSSHISIIYTGESFQSILKAYIFSHQFIIP